MSSKKFDYSNYVNDEKFLSDYNEYQKKYAGKIRESDRVIIDLLAKNLPGMDHGDEPVKILDIGCSTGNLLLHMKKAFPGCRFEGGDLAKSSLDECRKNPELEGVDFSELDVMDPPRRREFQVVVISATTCLLDEQQFALAMKRMPRLLLPGGLLILFEWFHSFEQNVEIFEVSKTHPEGMVLRFRPYSFVRGALAPAGFGEPEFFPFTLPIDLEKPGEADDLTTYTVPMADGRRLPFRGTLYQPWCHLTARLKPEC